MLARPAVQKYHFAATCHNILQHGHRASDDVVCIFSYMHVISCSLELTSFKQLQITSLHKKFIDLVHASKDMPCCSVD